MIRRLSPAMLLVLLCGGAAPTTQAQSATSPRNDFPQPYRHAREGR